MGTSGVSGGLDWGPPECEAQGGGLLPWSKGGLVPLLCPHPHGIHGLCPPTAGPGPPHPALPLQPFDLPPTLPTSSFSWLLSL